MLKRISLVITLLAGMNVLAAVSNEDTSQAIAPLNKAIAAMDALTPNLTSGETEIVKIYKTRAEAMVKLIQEKGIRDAGTIKKYSTQKEQLDGLFKYLDEGGNFASDQSLDAFKATIAEIPDRAAAEQMEFACAIRDQAQIVANGGTARQRREMRATLSQIDRIIPLILVGKTEKQRHLAAKVVYHGLRALIEENLTQLADNDPAVSSLMTRTQTFGEAIEIGRNGRE